MKGRVFTKPKAVETLPTGLVLGELVYYYLEGWRVGTLVEVKGSRAHIRPVAAFKASTPHLIWAQLEDVKGI